MLRFAFERFRAIFDFEIFCLELEYYESSGAAIREGAKAALDEKQRAFDAILTRHPATLVGNARRAEARRLEKERREKIAERRRAREEQRRRTGVKRLAQRWRAALVAAQAG